MYASLKKVLGRNVRKAGKSLFYLYNYVSAQLKYNYIHLTDILRFFYKINSLLKISLPTIIKYI